MKPKKSVNPKLGQAVLRQPADYWKVPRVARYMDVTPKRVYTLIRQGRLDAVRLGPRQIRVSRASIDALLRTLHCEAELAPEINFLPLPGSPCDVE